VVFTDVSWQPVNHVFRGKAVPTVDCFALQDGIDSCQTSGNSRAMTSQKSECPSNTAAEAWVSDWSVFVPWQQHLVTTHLVIRCLCGKVCRWG
jgi:hypothetical protein